MAKCVTWHKARLWFAALAVLLWLPRVASADDPAQRVVIVYNAEDPDSKPLADYYARKRGVPTNQICEIGIPVADTISRKQFNEKIRDPIWQFLTHRGLLQQESRTVMDPALGKVPSLATVSAKVSYLVLMYGVPLGIAPDPNLQELFSDKSKKGLQRDEASVESELALLPTTGLPIRGPLRNPFFGNASERFGPPLNQEILLVGRLDGPDAQTVRRMIDDAQTAEHYGLHGRAYFDAQGTHDPGYIVGDTWITNAWHAFQQSGYECDLDEQPETFAEDYPMTDAAIYAGWYSDRVVGPFRRPDFRFQTGAVAYHLHSSSGAAVRTRTAFWVGPLLAKGAAATMGNVYEPYLSLTPHIDMFFQRLLAGAPFLEAAYYSEPALSWQTTFEGDPLYRPFAASLDEQIQRLEADHKTEVEWAYLRRVNLLVAQDGTTEAEELCRSKAGELHSAVLYEKLGDMLRAARREREAIEAYSKADEKPADPYRDIRVAVKMATAHVARKETAQALAIYERLGDAYPTHHNVVEFFQRARDLARALGDEAKAKALQAKIDRLLPAGRQEKK
ncbi:MAG TPA: TIGR03790 family protein [Verrucomicrobiae bacterium]|nr:TIGR03790 family protein [Verrucomicrobiae bacterium]